MKKLLLILIGFVICCSCNQAQPVVETGEKESLVLNEQDIYKLYPTSNMWTFIKLNTADGRMWQLQYDVQGDERFEVVLNSLSLLKDGEKSVAGRFELYETRNMYNFILIDQIDARAWQTQWSMEENNRGIIPIFGDKFM